MSVEQRSNIAYGLSQALIKVPNGPIIAQRAPTSLDRANIGTLWIDQQNNNVFILTSIVDNVATWQIVSGTSFADDFNTDDGVATPAGSIVNIFGGSNINTAGAGNTVTINLNNVVNLPATNSAGTAGIYQIGGLDFAFAFPQSNTFVGTAAGNLTLNPGLAVGNSAFGHLAMVGVTTGAANTTSGVLSLTDLTTGSNNVAIGAQALQELTTTGDNTAVGANSLGNLLNGDANIALGFNAGSNYTGAESSNIIIGNQGVLGDDNFIRIGTQGSSAGQQDACYIAGIYGVTPSGGTQIVVINSSGELGSSAIGGGAIEQLTGDSGIPALPLAGSVGIAGGHNIATVGSANTITVNVAGTTNHAVQIGNATNSLTSVAVGTTGQVLIGATGADPAFGALGVNSGLTAHGILLGQNNSALTALGSATNGQIPIGSTGANPVLANITSTGTTITVTNGAGTINIDTASTIASSFPTDAGAATPAAGALTIHGGSNMTTSGATSTVTVALVSSPSVSGSLTAGTTVTAGTGITATTGAITATAGNVVVTAGNLTLPNTTAGFAEGVIEFGGTQFFSNFGVNNIFLGGSGNATLSGADNVGIGSGALAATTSGSFNMAIGVNSMTLVTSGTENAGIGYGTFQSLVSGIGNIGIGFNVLNSLLTGSFNTSIGYISGSAYTGSESDNLLINNVGVVGESNTIRIGTQGTGATEQDTCFIAGIAGTTVTSTAAVLVNTTTGQLGTIVSSRRYKENISDMDEASSAILNLRPVTFTYKNDLTRQKQYGLVAEEVDDVMPSIVTYNLAQDPETVRYHDLPVLLLNELQKQNNVIAELQHRIAILERRRGYESKA